MYDKAFDTCPFVLNFVHHSYITHEMCDIAVFKEHFMLKCCPDKYKTQKMCDKTVDSYMLTLKFVPDWGVISKMLEKLDNSLFSNDKIFFHDVDCNIVAFLPDDMGFNIIDRININQYDDFDEDNSENINYVRLMVWHNRLKQHKACEKK